MVSAYGQTIDNGGALGNASSALTNIDVIDFTTLSTNWGSSIKISRNFQKFSTDVTINAPGRLYMITAPNNLSFTTATQIKDFVITDTTNPGFKTQTLTENNDNNWTRTIAPLKDNDKKSFYNLIETLGRDYFIYIAYEDASGILDNEIVVQPVSLIQEDEAIELTHPSSPPYAYKLAYPIEYFNPESEKNFPVVVFLHGAGGGTDGAAGSPVFTSPREAGFSCLSLRPASGGGGWNINKMNQLIEHIKTTYADIIDPNRIYFMGYSMGARGVLDISLNHGNKLAAVFVNAGGFLGNNNNVPGMDFSLMADLPLWGVHNCNDGTVPIAKGWEYINATIAAGGKPKFLINTKPNPNFPNEDNGNLHPSSFSADYRNIEGSNGGHNSNNNYFYSEEMYTWLFSQTRSQVNLSTNATDREQFNMYPNPIIDKVYINLPNTNEMFNATIYNLSGNVIINKILNTNNNSIHLNNLASGIYFIHIKGKNSMAIKNLIKK